MNKLPSLYTNSFDKKIDNSIEYIKVNNKEKNRTLSINEINKKIDNIFKSKNYIYKVKVKITLKDKVIETYIIGKTNNNLITLDNELINIKDIENINEIKIH